MSYKIDKLIINSPYEKPKEYWTQIPRSSLFKRKPGRRPAGYIKATESKDPEEAGIFIEIPLVNKIRERVDKWREEGYPGTSGITRRLLEHWHDPEAREKRLFFCQLEAMETIIWQTEAPESSKAGIEIPGDGGPFRRLCCKMATGTGKTVVMAMLIAWQILNKATYPQDTRFTKYVFVVTPGLTIKSRLQVLYPDQQDNYYDEFNIVPYDLKEKLRQGKIKVTNWHKLNWDTEEQIRKKRSVDKRGVKSDEAYTREVLGELSKSSRILVINDEGHHAWRKPASSRIKVGKEDEQMATIWINGLDRIQRTRGILTCYDFSATPYVPTGGTSPEDTLYDWIISDFNLNDAIESGLVKTPRIVVRDDAQPTRELHSRLYHIYNDPEVKSDLNRRAKENEPLPSLVKQAYFLLGEDWVKTLHRWSDAGHPTPPVMITVANRTHTAARVKYAFDHKEILIEELNDPEKTLHIDSKVLKLAESQEDIISIDIGTDKKEKAGKPRKKLSRKERAELLRQQVDTIGKRGKPGEQIQNVISVGMLTEGWDAKTVTHVMGLRAFTSQLLCEQVVGRGLRRTNYQINEETGLLDEEYVQIFGIPFQFLPHETADGRKAKPPKPMIPIEPDPNKKHHEISIPNLIRVDYVYTPTLQLDPEKASSLVIDAHTTPTLADMAPVIDGKPDITRIETIRLQELVKRFRTQSIIFKTAKQVYEQIQPSWKGNKAYLIAQLIRLTEEFMESGKIQVRPPEYDNDDFKRRIILVLNIEKIIIHLLQEIKMENTLTLHPQFNPDRPIIRTGDMRTWYTSRLPMSIKKSHINHCVYDGTWEATESFELEGNPDVESWVKNDHLGFEILYIHAGTVRKYRPDFVIRLVNGTHLILETKGITRQKDRSKHIALKEWVEAVNQDGRFGNWAWAVSTHPKDVGLLIKKALNGTLH